jgi:hypothetical protein
MVESGMVVVDTHERQQQLEKVPAKRGRPRVHPVKEKKPSGKGFSKSDHNFFCNIMHVIRYYICNELFYS